MIEHVLYLHGLASSPASNKGRFYAQRLAQHGFNVRVPDLNVPDFEHLTLTAMLARVAEEMRALPAAGGVALIGSSMGGLTALHFADRYRAQEGARLEKLVLLAPALDFLDNRRKQLGDLDLWRAQGYLNWLHHSYGEERRLHYGLIEDAQQYDSYAVRLDLPILIYHGLHDASVDYQQSVRYAYQRPHVDLRLLDSDHQLLDKTEHMLAGILAFLGQ
ncbi:MAG: alpha/beta fold hydrolase [Chloroflexi bacterium]|nr:alpha/beta fold hydrolase [Chloroflexota bacterium]